MSTENANTPKKPAYDAAKIDEAIKRAKEQAGEKPAKTKEPRAEKPAKEPKAAKEPKPAKEPKAEKPAKEPKGPAHLSKVERATADLPILSDAAAAALKGIDEGGFAAGDLTALAAHLTHKARLLMTAGAVSAKPTVGSLVEILPGDKGVQKYVGMRGVLTEVRSIRCFADIKDENGKTIKKGLYLFTSGVKVITPAVVHDEGPEPEEQTEPTAGEFPIDPVATVSNDSGGGTVNADLPTPEGAEASDAAETEAVQAEGNETAGVEATGTDG